MVVFEVAAGSEDNGFESVQTRRAHVSDLKKHRFVAQTNLCRSKAVSDGAVSHYLEHFVTHRIANATYGTPVTIPFNFARPDHRKHIESAEMGPLGIRFSDGFSALVKKVSGASRSCDLADADKIGCRERAFATTRSSRKRSACHITGPASFARSLTRS